MNKLTKKLTAIGLCAALCTSGTCLAAAREESQLGISKTENITANEVTQTSQQEIYKDETVYVLADSDGSVKKIIVGDWLKNTLGSDVISDKSNLSDIENVKGDESYTVNGANMKVWDAQGNDIYYQGSIEKELPVGITVSYSLNGKKVSAEELAGKNGKVTIRFDYNNNQYEIVEINGKEEKIYVPFAMLTGMILDNENFRNVEVSNGKLINDGDRTIVVGFAFPGLQEDLNLSRDKIDIPNFVEITADVSDFEFGMTVTIATNEVFNNFDEEKVSDTDSLTGSLDKLTEAMTRLTDGSSALYNGLCTLLDKSGELVNGINQLVSGAKTIKDGADSLDDGAARLKAGLSELSTGLNTLSSNSAKLNDGAKQVFNTLLNTADTQLEAAGISAPELTIENYAYILDDVIASLDESTVYNKAQQQVTTAVEAKRPEITEKVTTAVQEEVTQQVTAVVQEQVTASVTATIEEQVASQVIEATMNMSKEDYDTAVAAGLVSEEQQAAIESVITQQMSSVVVQALIKKNVNEQMESSEVKEIIAANTETQMQSDTVQTIIEQNVEIQIQQAIAENMSSDAVQSQLAAASEGAKSVISLKASLDSYNAFYLGLLNYTDGVDSAASGAAELYGGASDLKDGTAQLKAGAEILYDGVLALQDGMPALVDGISQLQNGSMQLSDGLKQFNEQGIQKLMDFIDGDFEEIAMRLKATVDASKDYRNFAGIADGADGQVKFIYRTEEIKVN